MLKAVNTEQPKRVVQSIARNCYVLGAATRTPRRISIVVNEHYPGALGHIERHLAAEPERRVWICHTDCPGS